MPPRHSEATSGISVVMGTDQMRANDPTCRDPHAMRGAGETVSKTHQNHLGSVDAVLHTLAPDRRSAGTV